MVNDDVWLVAMLIAAAIGYAAGWSDRGRHQ
jgi:hypothetical protein